MTQKVFCNVFGIKKLENTVETAKKEKATVRMKSASHGAIAWMVKNTLC